MGIATIGATGSVESWGESGDDVFQLVGSAIAPMEFSLTQVGAQLDDTAFNSSGVSAMTGKVGLAEWTATLTGYYPRATKKIGNGGLVTFAAGDVLHVKGWNLNIEGTEIDITKFTGANVTDKIFRPGPYKWGGDYEGFVDSATAASNITAAGTAASAATFKATEEGAVDSSFSGNIYTNNLDIGVAVGSTNPNTKKYSFTGSGQLTHTYPTGLGLLGTSSPQLIVPSSWDKDGDGVPDRTLTLKADTGRTFVGAAFWKSISISTTLPDLIKVVVGVRGSGALTIS